MQAEGGSPPILDFPQCLCTRKVREKEVCPKKGKKEGGTAAEGAERLNGGSSLCSRKIILSAQNDFCEQLNKNSRKGNRIFPQRTLICKCFCLREEGEFFAIYNKLTNQISG